MRRQPTIRGIYSPTVMPARFEKLFAATDMCACVCMARQRDQPEVAIQWHQRLELA